MIVVRDLFTGLGDSSQAQREACLSHVCELACARTRTHTHTHTHPHTPIEANTHRYMPTNASYIQAPEQRFTQEAGILLPQHTNNTLPTHTSIQAQTPPPD